MTLEQQKATILIVDDTPKNIDILKEILLPDYKIKAATNGKIALKIAQSQPIDLILLDIMMPELDGYQVCKILKSDTKTNKIPVIFVTAMNDSADEEKGFKLGAEDYLTKPVVPIIVQARVKAHLNLANQRRAIETTVEQRTQELQKSQVDAITMLGMAGHYNDTDTGLHIWRMAAYGAALAKAAQLPVEHVHQLELAAPMHDLGKVGIPDEILKAPRRLTEQEMEIMKNHSYIGYKILTQSNTPLFKMAAEIAYCHHEKWDGSGYPQGLAGEEIPLSARIIAIADVFDALTMKRPYKKAWEIEEAFNMLSNEAGKHFDPELVSLFLSIKAELIEIKTHWDAKEDGLEAV